MALSGLLLYVGAREMGVATVPLLSLAAGFSMVPEGAFWSTAILIGGKHVGVACGVMNCGGNVGGMLAPILTPMIALKFGWRGGLYFASVVVLLAMSACLLVDPKHQATKDFSK